MACTVQQHLSAKFIIKQPFPRPKRSFPCVQRAKIYFLFLFLFIFSNYQNIFFKRKFSHEPKLNWPLELWPFSSPTIKKIKNSKFRYRDEKLYQGISQKLKIIKSSIISESTRNNKVKT